ncbi:major royal jelly protein 1-like [Neodiprion fabricii]|uniref:major royal jelly protein 1-like n=1 Tax=Neodiprion fabricii TaxID=2872261 RepID=UPI001ED94749|nr:major royal jelly protein 1-like [Neodiprion fabricii]
MTTPSRPFRILTIVLSCVGSLLAAELTTIHEWKYIEYAAEDPLVEHMLQVSEEYNYTKIIPIDFQKISGNRVLVTTPRYSNDLLIPSLSIVSPMIGDGGSLLEPYPNWDWHETGYCGDEIITSVSRLFTDQCNRLWFVDSGKIGDKQVCSAKLFAFNTTTDQVIHRIDIPHELTHNSVDPSKGRLEIQFVETKGDSCDETWAYIGDPEGYGLVIWDGSDIWRLENDDVYAPASSATKFSVAGENVTLELGTSIVRIPPPGFINEDYLLLRPLSSYSDYAIRVEDLHNSKNSSVTYYKGNITLPSQELVRVFSKSGVLMAALASSLVVACWNLANPLATEYVGTPLEDDEALQFTSAGKIFEGSEPGFEHEEYWMLTNRYQKFALGTMDFDDVNFRILSVNIADTVQGTVCAPSSHSATSIEDKFFFEYETV